MTGLTAVALALQFVPALAGDVHFLVPLGIQIVVCVWVALYFQLE